MFSKGATLVVVVLVLALGAVGTATGAAKLITGKQIKNNSITGADIKNSSLTVADLSAGVTGSLVSFVTTQSAVITVPADSQVYSLDAGCPAGSTVVGTGFVNSIASIGFVRSYGTFARLAVYNDTGVAATGVHVQAMCASVAGASLRSVNSGGKAQADKDLEKLKAVRSQ